MIKVYLREYLIKSVSDDYSMHIVTHMKTVLEPWIKQNIPEGEWRRDGVTIWSYRYEFEHESNAVAFKLTFGI